MESPNRSVIVNENDNRKLEIYEQGDLDASPSGIGMFACDPTTTMRILKTDDLGNLNVNLKAGNGLTVPYHNVQVIDEADPSNVVINYKVDSDIVATKIISVLGTSTSISITIT